MSSETILGRRHATSEGVRHRLLSAEKAIKEALEMEAAPALDLGLEDVEQHAPKRKKYPRWGLKRKVWLTEKQVESMLDIARSRSKRDFLIMLLLRWSSRVGEVVGHKALPGIRVEEVRKDGILLHGKGWVKNAKKIKVQPFPEYVLKLIEQFVAETRRTTGSKVVNLSERQAERMIKNYARLAGVPNGDWQLVTPHRLRAFFGNNAKWGAKYDSLLIRDLLRHDRLADTEPYIGTAPPDFLDANIQALGRRELEKKQAGTTTGALPPADTNP